MGTHKEDTFLFNVARKLINQPTETAIDMLIRETGISATGAQAALGIFSTYKDCRKIINGEPEIIVKTILSELSWEGQRRF